MDNREIKKGDIYYAKLDPIVGSEQNGTRPVVVIQNNYANKYSPVVLIAPLTSKVKTKPNLPTHIFVKANKKSVMIPISEEHTSELQSHSESS